MGGSQKVSGLATPALHSCLGRGKELRMTQHFPSSVSPWALPPFRFDVLLKGYIGICKMKHEWLFFFFLNNWYESWKPRGIHRMTKFKKPWGDPTPMLTEFPYQAVLHGAAALLLFWNECREKNFPRATHWRPKGHSDFTVASHVLVRVWIASQSKGCRIGRPGFAWAILLFWLAENNVISF